METGRFAPSTTGPAHPGTLLAALLCWLDARSRGARCVLRLEDLDPERSTPERVAAMREALDWFGLDFDSTELQSEARADHERALDQLEARDLLYPCGCSRREIREAGRRGPDGGFAYSNRCRERALPAGGWRASDEPLRARLPDGRIEPVDEAGEPVAQSPARELGDPIVRRRDGGVAYHLASVVDDARAGVTRVVRGRDLAASTATQVALQRLLDLPEPVYRHHFLLLEERDGDKLAKLHGAVGLPELLPVYGPGELCAVLARGAGFAVSAVTLSPHALLEDFAWQDVALRDRAVRWTGTQLEWVA